MKRKNQLVLTLIVLLAVFFIDRITKLLATHYLEGKNAISFFYNTVVLEYVENKGAFLSLGSDWPDYVKYIALLVVPIAVCFYGLYYCAFKLTDKKQVVVFVCIIGGGLGNLIDRVFNDFSVVDFLNVGIASFRTGILNVADMSVTFGIVYLVIEQFKGNRLRQVKPKV
jgi:signal peptidase II